MDQFHELKEALRENRLERAGELCRDLLRETPDNVELLSLAGMLTHRNGEHERALELFSRATRLNPSLPELHNNTGVTLECLGRSAEAASKYLDALALRPNYTEANCNLGNAFRALGRNEEAIRCYRTAISIDPVQVDSHLGLGNALRAAERWEEATRSYRNVVKIQPSHLAGWTNLGGCLLALNRFPEAIAAERRAVAVDPENLDAHFNLALALLAGGDLRQGWREYEWRLRRPGGAFSDTFHGKGLWDGSPLRGRTLLLRAEQGFGDALQFFRYLPLLARQEVRVVLECRRELHPLLASQSPDVTCFAVGDHPPPFDTFAYLMSLPLLLGTTLETIPAEIPYLAADPARVALWGARMQARRGLRVGLVWAGSAGYRNDRSRSLPVRLLAPLAAIAGITLFSLQLGTAAAELADEPWGREVHDLSDAIADFADTAAIVANLDVVVSVDTAVAHLAGAMGKRVMLMLPFSCDWRWLHGRSDSPWYPGMRLYRQAERGDWEGVIAAIASDLSAATAATASDPDQLNTLFRNANRLRKEGRLDEAVALYRRLVDIRPDLAEVHNNLGLALQDRGELVEAEACYRRTIALDPTLADGYNNLGALLVSRGAREAAVPCFRQALAARDDCVPAYVNLGSALQRLGRPEEAVPLYRRAIELQPSAIEARINLGTAYQELTQPEEAVSVYEESLRLQPEHPELHWNLALSLLSMGRFERGWREYEWRLHSAGCRQFPKPRWEGGALYGKTILLDCEQGLGDTLQFVRYAPLLAGLGGRVLLRCQFPPLKPLLARVPGVAEVYAREDALPEFDCYSPLLSLPHLLGTTIESTPGTVPYLTPDPKRTAHFSASMGARTGLKVGLVWRGGPLPQNRACPYAELAPLRGVEGVTFYTLQLGESPDQLVLPAVDLAPEIRDFGDSAAIVANLDLVVSVDTAMAHLAGGMGVPVWTMLPYACDWRWMLDRTDSPWYPTMRLFRQEHRGDWGYVVTRLREELQAEVAHRTEESRQNGTGRPKD